MSNDGKRLEALVAFIEEQLLPQGFEVRNNTRVYNDDGVQVAEFDVEIRGKLGSTQIAWLIECRDRPGQGPAPSSWIEQLVGRRSRFGFNKVTAVSTTGFATGAVEYAQQARIELREVKELTPEHFSDWLLMRHMHIQKQIQILNHTKLFVSDSEPDDRKQALLETITNKKLELPLLRSTETGAIISALDAFSIGLSVQPTLYEGIVPNGQGKQVELRVSYPNDESHYVVDTKLGAVRITEILFSGELAIKEFDVPLTQTIEYIHNKSGDPISQSAAFVFDAENMRLSFELHKLSESGVISVVIRKLEHPNG